MNRRLTALFAAFEALLVVAIGVAIPLLAFTALWAFQYGLQLDWVIFWRGAVDAWLIGHGVDVRFALDPQSAAQLGLPGAGEPVVVTIAALGFALLTLLLGVRAGRRIGETDRRLLGELVSLGTFALASSALTFSALHELARPSLWQGAVLPTAVFAVGLAIGVRVEAQDAGGALQERYDRLPATPRRAVTAALRAGTAAAAGVLLVASVVTALAVVLSFAEIITLYESLHGDALGGFAITLAELALLPNLVIWTAAWLIGPGFAIGAGSAVSPIGATLGPIPALPVLGALPTGDLAFGFVGLLAPVIVGFVIGVLLAPRERHTVQGGALVLAGIGAGLVGGLLLGLLAWASGGAAGPGRLVEVGPDPVAVGVCAAIELAVAIPVGVLAGGRLPRR
ncbi:MAG TPA: DUF6350 family protein [Rhodoglobus sp.]|nr:DUF6350 family protein [Rhodoglobus sp.]